MRTRWSSGARASKLAGAALKPLGVPAARPARPSLGKHHCSPPGSHAGFAEVQLLRILAYFPRLISHWRRFP